MSLRAASLPPVSPLGRGFAQLQALHGSAREGEHAAARAPFRHNQFLRVLTATLGSPSPTGIAHTAPPATVRSHGSSSNKQGPEGVSLDPANAMEAGNLCGVGHA
jgi:hypothetical protein